MDAWVRALVALAPQLERPVVRARVVPLALSKAQAHETSVQACPVTPYRNPNPNPTLTLAAGAQQGAGA